MNVEIVKFDNNGRGIGYLNDKIIFVPKSIPGDIVNVEITLEKKNFFEGKILEIIKPSRIRIKPKCPYFDICGGCDLMNISVSENLDYKLNKVNEILTKNKINFEVKDIIKSNSEYNYRNKITLKVINGKVGYFENNSHKLVEINYCYICNDIINDLIKDLKYLNIINGEIIIRVNYNAELLLYIKSDDKIEGIDKLINNHKIVGIVQNDKAIYGESYFIDKINNYMFKVSYNSFFQVNPYICSKLFELIEKETNDSKKVIDLYCGVGTLSIVASKKASLVLGVEIVENAIIDAKLNKSLNNRCNIDFICNDTRNIIDKISSDFDTIILDPPRSGVSSKVIEKIITENINKIIYVSCNPITLVRDLKLLENNYCINEFKLLEMFPNSEHVESFVVLKKLNNGICSNLI